MKTALRTATALPLVALSLALLASPAMAQTASDEATAADDAAPGDIVVTAQKRKESLQSVPLAVSVLSGERLADAPVGHGQAGHAGGTLELLHQQVVERAHAGGAVVGPARICFGVDHEFLQRLDR